MAWGDHTRVERKIDEQQKIGQSYLSGTQQNIGNQYGAMNSLYWGGGGAPNYGSSFGQGSTVPTYNQYGQSVFQGNGTDTPNFSQTGTPWTPTGGFGGIPGGGATPNYVGSGMSSGANANYEQQFNALFPGDTISSADLIAHEQDLAKMGVRLMGPNAAGLRTKIMLPNGQSVDLIGSAGAGGGTGRKQWLVSGGGGGGPMGGGGGSSIGQYGQGGIPGMALNDYGAIQGLYGNYIGSASNMAETGGLSEADKANLRARAISPIRSVYAQGLQNVNRQRSLQGGYSPGYGTLMGRFNREQGQATSDATTNAEAAIAELVQRGKIAGLGAWNQGLGGMSSLYGTQPGMARMFGDQLQNSMENQLKMGGLQNELNLGIMGQENYMGSHVLGNLDSALNSAQGGMKVASGVGGVLNSLPGTNSKLDPRNWGKTPNGQFVPNTGQRTYPDYGDPNMVPGDYPNAENSGPFGGPTESQMYGYDPMYGNMPPDTGQGYYIPGQGNVPDYRNQPGAYGTPIQDYTQYL